MRRVFSILLLSATIATAAALAQSGVNGNILSIVEVNGRAEVRGANDLWRPLATLSASQSRQQNPENGLRTGVGRVKLQSGKGKLLMGSRSQVRVYRQKPDLQSGHFFVEGPAAVYLLGRHMVMEKAGSFRVDIAATGQKRVAVLNGHLRISGNKGINKLKAGQQMKFPTTQVTKFKEEDPWYLAQFIGIGSAQIEGLRGDVFVTRTGKTSAESAKLQMSLDTGDNIKTADKSWAELSFAGGGYLRLAEKSELSVLSIEKTNKGREVVMQLQAGSAWNVVAKGLGGYRISTPVLSTAVRGTTFRVDASGLVKVIEGSVVLPSATSEVSLSTGQQKQDKQPIEKLQLDAQDKWNISLDKERGQPAKLTVKPLPKYAKTLLLQGKVLSNTKLLAQVKHQQQAKALTLVPTPDGSFSWRNDTVIEGKHTLSIIAQRYKSSKSWQDTVIIDRTKPSLSDSAFSHQGRILTIKGVAADNSLSQEGSWLKLKLEINGQVTERWLSGWSAGTYPFRFTYILPASQTPKSIALTLIDRAGNETYVRLR